jgi:hypothetical protein
MRKGGPFTEACRALASFPSSREFSFLQDQHASLALFGCNHTRATVARPPDAVCSPRRLPCRGNAKSHPTLRGNTL